jgi:hypothetical protein
MWEQVSDVLRRSALRTAENVADFLPGVIGLAVIVSVALLFALTARIVVARVLRGMQFDRNAERWGLDVVADWSAVGGLSTVVARATMWMILLVGLLIGFSALDAALPEAFARRVFAYLPNVLAALLILMLGAILARYLARSALIGAVNLQWPAAGLWSSVVKWLVLIVAWVTALEHLGIARQTLMLAFGLLFGGAVLAGAIAVGLAARDLVRRALAGEGGESHAPDKLTHV